MSPMLFQALGQAAARGISGRRAGTYYDIDGGQLVLMKTERFANQALDAIAPDGVTHGLGGDGDTQSWKRQLIGSHDDREHRIGVAAALLVHAIEIRLAT